MAAAEELGDRSLARDSGMLSIYSSINYLIWTGDRSLARDSGMLCRAVEVLEASMEESLSRQVLESQVWRMESLLASYSSLEESLEAVRSAIGLGGEGLLPVSKGLIRLLDKVAALIDRTGGPEAVRESDAGAAGDRVGRLLGRLIGDADALLTQL